MFGFTPKLPIGEDERRWLDEGFRRLEKLVGRHRMLEAKVVEPTAEDFPDPYDRSPDAVEKLFLRVCNYMRVDRDSVELEIFQDETEELIEILPHWRGDGGTRAAGFYLHASEQDRANDGGCGRMVVAIRSTSLRDPMSLVATVAHELGHVILLGGKLMDPKPPDYEPLTDLLTVFLGLGIFTANSACRFKQYQTDRRIGWSMSRLGYLTERMFGYALAKFAVERDDDNAKWAGHLSPNVRSDFKRSRRWLVANPDYVPLAKPIG
jgi:hypothetical protein